MEQKYLIELDISDFFFKSDKITKTQFHVREVEGHVYTDMSNLFLLIYEE